MTRPPDIDSLAAGVAAGDRRALARAITLVESARPDHRALAIALLDRLGTGRQAFRIGLSGTPGVGKSTFIEGFGLMLAGEAGEAATAPQPVPLAPRDALHDGQHGKDGAGASSAGASLSVQPLPAGPGLRVAVLAVDPSSARSGGSILGDKTRMDRLARHPRAFIRPSPSRTELGGVARRTREAVALCEAAGFDVVLIETVGVGQSETLVAEMSDLFVLLLAPAGGDELQGVKRGIMEIADLILVNKADGDLAAQAMRTCADYAGALRLLRRRPQDPEGFPKAMTVSAAEGRGLGAAWAEMRALADWRRGTGTWDRTRAAQARHWFHEEVRARLLARLTADADLRDRLATLEAEVAGGRLSPAAAAEAALAPQAGAGGRTGGGTGG